ncbi:multiple epidermal growth factor-like domains protein 10 isoform X2 [Haliotis cracherodii]|uniref:multiple epidermal growth factor-like domains protein 10 isoform X2 n=1 Tax=Haliotis cracherodii TaxID=6455 RepID=UPI0039E7F477
MIKDKDRHAFQIYTLNVSSPQLIVVHVYFNGGQRQMSQLYSQAETTSWLSNMAGVWILTVIVVTSACWIQVIIGSCPTGKFGDSCFYSCHCGDSCNQTTGVCEGACDAGWVGGHGATCQKENIAKGKSATSPSGLYFPPWTADKAVDGNQDQDYSHNSCFHAKRTPSVWTVDLGQQYRIHDVRIYNRLYYIDRLQTAVLSLSNSSSSIPGVTCYIFPNDTAETVNSVYDVTCDGTGRYFTISHSTETLNLCEVEIFVCSHGTFGELCNHFCHCSDGSCDRFSGICAGDCRPAWQGKNCSTACDKDRYGVNCNETCGKCAAAPSSCDRHTGSCDTGCLPGWIGVDCKQACEPHRYGPSCDKTCASRHCVGHSSCNTTGHCHRGCQTGWTLDDCTACDSQHYGPDCIKTCASRHCVGNSSCNSTGRCDTRCETGWTGADCTVAGAAVGVVCWRRRQRP